MTARIIRNDGKPARKPRLGVPTSSLATVKRGPVDEKAPSWHELVQAGPKGDTTKALARAEQVRHGVTLMPSSVEHGRQQHGVPVRRWPMFGLVLHRTRVGARSGGGIDRSRLTDAALGNRKRRADAKTATS